MSKAIEGAALIGGAALLSGGFLGAFGVAIAGVLNNSAFAFHLLEGLALTGVAMEAGAIADALTSNRGTNITTRQPAAARQIIYGTQRVGGIKIWDSTTGSTHNQRNYVIVLAGHVCSAIEALYLDGRKVYFNASSGGHNTSPDGTGFGGSADGGTYTGPGGQSYNFGGKVYCEARYGTQSVGDVISGLTANDSRWAARGGRSPYVGGCTYVYLKLVYDDATFPGDPEIRFTVRGKPLYDPRTSTTAYSANWALVANDILTDTVFGLGDNTVNQAQLIAAANVCDEQVLLSSGSYESRWQCHMHYDTSVGPGNALERMMPGAAGRLSRIGGEYFLWPAYWQGPSFSWDQSVLTGGVEWTPNRSLRDLFNRVTGTYTAANYPYNVAGNLYDSSGWFDGTTENTFPFGFQTTNFPQFACDVAHGYSSDQYLTADGFPLPMELTLDTVLSITQAQRAAKIALMRNRQQGSGRLEMSLAAQRMQPLDVMNFTFPALGWTNKVLELSQFTWKLDKGSEDTAPSIRLSMQVQETASAVYAWSTAEEQTIYAVPASPSRGSYTVAPPTSVALISSAATALVQPSGDIVPRIEVTWSSPLDVLVTQIQGRYRKTGDSAWINGFTVGGDATSAFIFPVIAGQQYDVQIRSMRSGGAVSDWVEIDGFTAGLVLNVQTQDGFGPGSLSPEAYTSGTAGIVCRPFTALVGQLSLNILPSGSVTLTGLAQRTLYYVYYVDLTTTGGDVTPIATTNPSDFLGKLGYFLIGSCITPFVGSSSGGGGGGGSPSMLYRPSRYTDFGSRLAGSPTAAYDGDLSSCATISGDSTSDYYAGDTEDTSTSGFVTYTGFDAYTAPADMTLHVQVSAFLSHTVSGATAGSVAIIASVGGVDHNLLTSSTSVSLTDLTLTVPMGTDLSSISVSIDSEPGDAGATSGRPHVRSSTTVQAYEIYIQT